MINLTLQTLYIFSRVVLKIAHVVISWHDSTEVDNGCFSQTQLRYLLSLFAKCNSGGIAIE